MLEHGGSFHEHAHRRVIADGKRPRAGGLIPILGDLVSEDAGLVSELPDTDTHAASVTHAAGLICYLCSRFVPPDPARRAYVGSSNHY